MSKYRMQTSLYILFLLIISFNTSADSSVDFGPRPYMNAVVSNGGTGQMTEVGYKALMNPLMILVKIIKLRWIHILSYDQMV
ncbi:hypothetical protein AB7W11_18025, partial [Providencia manganoxydans]|uniref:hypothetical protein n=1 Tax=Providencia manganoxydans TaxID=2923283 RepID=UPI0034E551A4